MDFVAIVGGREAMKKRGSAATFAEKAKIKKYGKRFSNLLDKLHQIIFAATEAAPTACVTTPC